MAKLLGAFLQLSAANVRNN